MNANIMDKLALIILNYNSFNDCIICIDQLLSFKQKFHIIIVDNASSDDSYNKLKKRYMNTKFVDIIQTGFNRGYSAGNNYGIKYAMRKYEIDTVGILNPDVFIPNAELLEVLLTKLYMDTNFAVIGGLAIDIDGNYNPSNSAWDIPSQKNVILDHLIFSKRCTRETKMHIISSKLVQVECVAGCFFLAKVLLLQKMDFFDENVFLYNEENILGIKCKRYGYKEVVAIDQFYYHNHRHVNNKTVTFKGKFFSTRNGYLSRKYLCSTYYSKKMLPFLWMTEMLNRIYLVGCYLKNKLSP